ncbi:MAG: GNAT family N-acyltransferase [Acidobacteriota bacterium]
METSIANKVQPGGELQPLFNPTSGVPLPQTEIRDGRYLARFARTHREVEAALRLRYEVFNLELGEGLESSALSGLDRDGFDDSCDHLIVLDEPEQRVVGTYRLQTADAARAGQGFYSAQEFDLSTLSAGVIESSVELGRACIARDHRNSHVLFLLWKGIASYVAFHRKRYLFGCCSLTSQDMAEGNHVYSFLQQTGQVHAEFAVAPRSDFACGKGAAGPEPLGDVTLPKLFRAYLRYGARVCSPPAIDRQFKTIDFLVIFDVDAMDSRSHRLLFGA